MAHYIAGFGFLPIPNCCRKMERRRSGSRGRIAVQSLPTPWVTVIHGRCRPGERRRQAAMRQQLRQRWPPIPWSATAIQALPTKKAATKCLNTAPSFCTVSSLQRGVVVARTPLYVLTHQSCTPVQGVAAPQPNDTGLVLFTTGSSCGTGTVQLIPLI